MILVRRYSEKDGHQLKHPYKTSLFKFLHDNQISNSPRIQKPKKKLHQEDGPPCNECTESLPCDAENLEQCKKKRGIEEEEITPEAIENLKKMRTLIKKYEKKE